MKPKLIKETGGELSESGCSAFDPKLVSKSDFDLALNYAIRESMLDFIFAPF